MGSSPPQSQPIVDSKLNQPKRKKSKIQSPPKQKAQQIHKLQHQPQELKTIDKKQIQISQQLDSHLRDLYQEEKNLSIDRFKTKFLSRVSRKQIKLFFKEKEDAIVNSSGISQYSDQSILKLEKECSLDFKIYIQILEARLKYVFNQIIKEKGESNTYSEEQLREMREILQNKINEGQIELLGEIEGKTSAWSSLHLSLIDLKTKIQTFIRSQGLQPSLFPFLEQQTSYR